MKRLEVTPCVLCGDDTRTAGYHHGACDTCTKLIVDAAQYEKKHAITATALSWLKKAAQMAEQQYQPYTLGEDRPMLTAWKWLAENIRVVLADAEERPRPGGALVEDAHPDTEPAQFKQDKVAKLAPHAAYICSACGVAWVGGHSFANCIVNVRAQAWREAALIVASAPRVREDSAGHALVLRQLIVDQLRLYADQMAAAPDGRPDDDEGERMNANFVADRICDEIVDILNRQGSYEVLAGLCLAVLALERTTPAAGRSPALTQFFVAAAGALMELGGGPVP